MSGRARRTVLAVAAVLTLLLLAAPRPSSAVALLARTGQASDPTGPLVAAVALAAWVLALWLTTVVVLVLTAALPGVLGRAAAAVGRRTAPLAVRRTLELALGVTVTVGAASVPAAAAVAPGAHAAAGGQPGAATPALPSLDWPDLRTSHPSPAPVAHRPAQQPAAGSPSAPATDDQAAGTPTTQRPSPGARAGGAVPSGSSAEPSRTAGAVGAPVVVRPGDTLWALAEAHLERTGGAAPTDSQVAAAWPQWWSVNRPTVGDDPDLIHPGAVLRPPPP